MTDLVISFESTLEFKMQNRSQSANLSNSTDVIDSNPVQGYIYDFAGIPRTRDAHANNTAGGSVPIPNKAWRFESVRFQDGLRLIRGGDLPNGYKEPINGKMFTNCKGQTRFRLEPGAIKHIFRKYKVSHRFNTLIDKIRVASDNASPGNVNKFVGGGVLFGVEDVINVNSTANITMTYETEHRVCCVIKESKSTPMLSGYVTDTYNLITA